MEIWDKENQQSVTPNFPIFEVLSFTQEEQEQINKEAAIFEKNIMLEDMDSAYFHCGAAQRQLDKAGFEKYIILENTDRKIRLAQELLLSSARQFAQAIIDNKHLNLVLVGKPGIGKTFIALSIIKEITHTIKIRDDIPEEWNVKGHYSAAYRTSDRLCEELKEASSFSSKLSKYAIIDKYAGIDLLVIDEIGRTTQKNERDTLFAIFDSRFQEGKSTIFISNYTIEELEKALGSAMWSRISNSGYVFGNENLGDLPDMRQIGWKK